MSGAVSVYSTATTRLVLYVAGFFTPASPGSPACNLQVCPQDVVCNFNTASFCGTPAGDVRICDGACGRGLCTQGQGRVTLADSPVFSELILELEAQVRFSHLPGQGEFGSAIVSKYMGQFPGSSEWWLGVAGNGARQWTLCGDGTVCVLSAMGVVQENTLYHVRGVLNGPSGEIWVDDQLVASGSLTRNSSPTTTPAVIAGSAGGDSVDPFFGMIDEVRIGCPLPQSN
jgi:hypothetical protein